MISNKKHFIWTIVIVAIAIAINIFIIIQSCLNGVRSTSSSGWVVTLFKNIINTFSKDAINDGNISTFTYVIRKLIGHFGLFVLSGVSSTLALHFASYYLKNYKWWYGLVFTLFFGLFLAGLTELIQSFIPSRSGEVLDVLIDFSGYVLGTGIIVLILFLTNRKKQIVK